MDHTSLMIVLISHTISCISELISDEVSGDGDSVVVVVGVAVFARAAVSGVAIIMYHPPILASASISGAVSDAVLATGGVGVDSVGSVVCISAMRATGVVSCSGVILSGRLDSVAVSDAGAIDTVASCIRVATSGSGDSTVSGVCSGVIGLSGKSTRTTQSVTMSAAKLVPTQLIQANQDGRVYAVFLADVVRSDFFSLLR